MVDSVTSHTSEQAAVVQNSSRPQISQIEVLVPDQGTREVKGFVSTAPHLSGRADHGMDAWVDRQPGVRLYQVFSSSCGENRLDRSYKLFLNS